VERGAETATDGAPAHGGATGSGGSGQPPPAPPPTSLEIGGVRTFILDVPAGYDPDPPTPVIFGFHGAGTSGALYRRSLCGNLLSTFGDGYLVVHSDVLVGDGDRTTWDSTGGSDVLASAPAG